MVGKEGMPRAVALSAVCTAMLMDPVTLMIMELEVMIALSVIVKSFKTLIFNSHKEGTLREFESTFVLQ